MYHNKTFQMAFTVGYHTKVIVNILFKTSIFPVIGKKNNQSLVSNADQKIPTSGQGIMPETRLTSFPALSVYPWVEISSSALETDDTGRLYLYRLPVYCCQTAKNKDYVATDDKNNRKVPYKFYVLGQIGLSKQCRPRSRSSLIKVYAVCHSISIFWTL